MDMNLCRKSFLSTGIFGELYSSDESLTLFTLEHAYPDSSGIFLPKIPPGSYICRRGIHLLDPTEYNPEPKPFETFQICDVPGHSNILIHRGNKNNDSAGCVLVGLFRSGDSSIMQSRAAFSKFMAFQKDINEFILTIS